MRNRTERAISKEIFYQIIENIPPNSYFFCVKCNATKIDTTELSKFIIKFVNQAFYSYENRVVEMADIMDNILCDILETAPDNLNPENLQKWHLENEKRLFDRWQEEDEPAYLLYDVEDELHYFVYDSVIFYQNVECECYLRKNIDQESIYSVRFE